MVRIRRLAMVRMTGMIDRPAANMAAAGQSLIRTHWRARQTMVGMAGMMDRTTITRISAAGTVAIARINSTS
jgi:hypothetical protein